jgi:FMNH2-dependent dimethyl sulfone monooxygenase
MKPRPSDSSHLSVNYFFPSGQTNLVWSDEAARRTPRINRENLLELARTAEQVGFDALFIADNWSGHQREAERAGHQSPAFHAPLPRTTSPPMSRAWARPSTRSVAGAGPGTA